MRLIVSTYGHVLRTLPWACLTLALGACKGPDVRRGDTFARDMRAALAAMEAPAGPCEICGEQSDSKKDRKTLTLDGQLIEFCCQDCAGAFYSDPNWKRYRKK